MLKHCHNSDRLFFHTVTAQNTTVTFRRTNRPSITLCFFDPYLQEKLKEFKTNVSEYTRFLQGQYWDPKLLKVNYDDVTIDLKEYLLGYDIWYSEKGCKWKRNGKNRIKREEQKQPPRGTIRPLKQTRQQISYKTLDEICSKDWSSCSHSSS